MLLSYNWLKSFLPDLRQSPQKVAELLTLHSFETEVVREIQIDPKIITVRIEKINPHPNADRLRLATITTGEEEITVVCGAPNIEEGQIVPYAPPGATGKDQDGQPFILKEASIRGVSSPGMINSARELGLSSDHAGIFILPPDTPVGAKLSQCIPDDAILEADITPNRAHDCLSHLGVARELAALLGLTVEEPSQADLSALPQGDLTLNIASDEVSAYSLLDLQGTTPAVAPLEIQLRLLAMGVRPHSAAVDITNYVMFEMGQPSHAFAANKLHGSAIGVRPANRGEELIFIDSKTRPLPENALTITNEDQPIAAAGIMGGEKTEVEKTSSHILLEVANFHAYTIQETARQLNMRSEASLRFSKGLDPNLVQAATARLAYLFEQVTGAKPMALATHYPRPRTAPTITYNPQQLAKVAGVPIGHSDAKAALERLRCTVREGDNTWEVTPPTDRLDLTIPADITEEVLRLHGLENLPAAKDSSTTPQSLPPAIYWTEYLRQQVAYYGFTETLNQTFMPAAEAQLLELDISRAVAIANPPAPDLALMRISLLPGLLKNLITNREQLHRKGRQKVRALFEIGHVMWQGEEGSVPGVVEESHLAAATVGNPQALRQLLDDILILLDIQSVSWQKAAIPYLENGGEVLVHKGEVIGRIGLLNKPVTQRLKYRLPVAVMELSLEHLLSAAPEREEGARQLETRQNDKRTYQPLLKYPSAFRDISLLVSVEKTIEEIQQVIEYAGKQYILDVDLFDEYEPADSDQKGLAFVIEYSSTEKTLTDREVNDIHKKVCQELERSGIQVR